MKRIYILIVTTLVILIGLGLNASQAFEWEDDPSYAYRSDNLLRLHILADSSSPEDQYLKRQVRDLILHETKTFFQDVPDFEQAIEVTNTNLPNLQRKVEEYLHHQGNDIQVKMDMGRFHFPTRTYGDVTLPAGEYQALRVMLGKGEGNNWWCVLFPPLCLDQGEEKVDEKQLMAMAYDPTKVKVEYRLKLWETMKTVPGWIAARCRSLFGLAAVHQSAMKK